MTKMSLKTFALSASLASGLFFSGVTVAAEQKIMSIRLTQVVQSWPEFKSSQEALKTDLARRKAELDAEVKRINDDEQKLNREALGKSETDQKKAMQELSSRKFDLQYKADQFQKDAQKRSRDLEESLLVKIRTAVEAVAKEKGATVVVQEPVYSVPDVDITNDVIKRLSTTK
jgi:outer membrane protein